MIKQRIQALASAADAISDMFSRFGNRARVGKDAFEATEANMLSQAEPSSHPRPLERANTFERIVQPVPRPFTFSGNEAGYSGDADHDLLRARPYERPPLISSHVDQSAQFEADYATQASMRVQAGKPKHIWEDPDQRSKMLIAAVVSATASWLLARNIKQELDTTANLNNNVARSQTQQSQATQQAASENAALEASRYSTNVHLETRSLHYTDVQQDRKSSVHSKKRGQLEKRFNPFRTAMEYWQRTSVVDAARHSVGVVRNLPGDTKRLIIKYLIGASALFSTGIALLLIGIKIQHQAEPPTDPTLGSTPTEAQPQRAPAAPAAPAPALGAPNRPIHVDLDKRSFQVQHDSPNALSAVATVIVLRTIGILYTDHHDGWHPDLSRAHEHETSSDQSISKRMVPLELAAGTHVAQPAAAALPGLPASRAPLNFASFQELAKELKRRQNLALFAVTAAALAIISVKVYRDMHDQQETDNHTPHVEVPSPVNKLVRRSDLLKAQAAFSRLTGLPNDERSVKKHLSKRMFHMVQMMPMANAENRQPPPTARVVPIEGAEPAAVEEAARRVSPEAAIALTIAGMALGITGVAALYLLYADIKDDHYDKNQAPGPSPPQKQGRRSLVEDAIPQLQQRHQLNPEKRSLFLPGTEDMIEEAKVIIRRIRQRRRDHPVERLGDDDEPPRQPQILKFTFMGLATVGPPIVSFVIGKNVAAHRIKQLEKKASGKDSKHQEHVTSEQRSRSDIAKRSLSSSGDEAEAASEKAQAAYSWVEKKQKDSHEWLQSRKQSKNSPRFEHLPIRDVSVKQGNAASSRAPLLQRSISGIANTAKVAMADFKSLALRTPLTPEERKARAHRFRTYADYATVALVAKMIETAVVYEWMNDRKDWKERQRLRDEWRHEQLQSQQTQQSQQIQTLYDAPHQKSDGVPPLTAARQAALVRKRSSIQQMEGFAALVRTSSHEVSGSGDVQPMLKSELRLKKRANVLPVDGVEMAVAREETVDPRVRDNLLATRNVVAFVAAIATLFVAAGGIAYWTMKHQEGHDSEMPAVNPSNGRPPGPLVRKREEENPEIAATQPTDKGTRNTQIEMDKRSQWHDRKQQPRLAERASVEAGVATGAIVMRVLRQLVIDSKRDGLLDSVMFSLSSPPDAPRRLDSAARHPHDHVSWNTDAKNVRVDTTPSWRDPEVALPTNRSHRQEVDDKRTFKRSVAVEVEKRQSKQHVSLAIFALVSLMMLYRLKNQIHDERQDRGSTSAAPGGVYPIKFTQNSRLQQQRQQ